MNNLIRKTSKSDNHRIEDDCDIKFVPSQYDPKTLCRQCLQCGNISGTRGIITHNWQCKYSTLNPKIVGPFIEGYYEIPSTSFDKSSCLYVLQREYGIVNKDSKKYIISSFGAVSCVILCMRNIETTETILAHIDGNTIDPIAPFLSFPPGLCDVYIVGGDNSTMEKVNQLLVKLSYHYYDITYAHIIDENINNFTINAIDGKIYCNLYDMDKIVPEDKEHKTAMMKKLCLTVSPLKRIIV